VTPPRLGVALGAAAAGGILGSLARAGLTSWLPVSDAFPWTVFWINVVGSAVLASVPALAAVRRTPWLGVFLGTGVLGGFTTMSTASEQSVALFEHHHVLTGVFYCAGTLAAAVAAVAAVGRWIPAPDRVAAEAAGVDE
jgi:CrcB protein